MKKKINYRMLKELIRDKCKHVRDIFISIENEIVLVHVTSYDRHRWSEHPRTDLISDVVTDVFPNLNVIVSYQSIRKVG